MRKEPPKTKAIYIVSIFVLMIILIGISYALLQKTLPGSKENIVKAGNLSLVVAETSNSISLSETYPVTDSEGLASTGFSFSVQNNGTVGSNYEISLEDVAINENQVRLSDENIKYSLTKNEEVGAVQLLSEVNRVLDSDFLGKGKSKTYELKLWLREDFIGEIEGQVFKTKLQIKAVQGEDKSLANRLIKKYSNDPVITTYNDGDKTKMYTFQQNKALQQADYSKEELTEYRYIGNVANNYIKFNNELWRIIGVFTVEDGAGNKEKRVKIMREESIGSYAFDNTTTEYKYGKNQWSDAKLNYLLNPGHESESIGGSLYWNQSAGKCYARENNDSKACDFTTSGLSEEAKKMIDDAKWYVAGWESSTISGADFYAKERGNTTVESTTFPREISWIGKVAVMYASDYAYTYALGVDNRCYTQISMCYTGAGGYPTSGWMYNAKSRWTLTPDTGRSDLVYYVHAENYVGIVSYIKSLPAYNEYNVHPVVYLTAEAMLKSGTGTSSDPFQISL